jgi:glycosyl transferase, family 25
MDNVITLLINLDRSKDRLAKTGSKLTELGIDWERFPAVDGWARQSEIASYVDEKSFRQRHGKPPVPGEVGCYLSHIHAMQHFLNTSREYALILEDDIVLSTDLSEVVSQLIAHPHRWDMVRLSGMHSGTPLKLLRLDQTPYSIAVSTTSYTGSSCYLVNKKAARTMVEALLPMRLPYDLAYERAWETGLKVRMVTPAPCGHSFDMGSVIHQAGVVRLNFHWSKRLPTYAWRIKNDLQRFVYGLGQYVKEKIFIR